jgi:hypothetical protein
MKTSALRAYGAVVIVGLPRDQWPCGYREEVRWASRQGTVLVSGELP